MRMWVLQVIHERETESNTSVYVGFCLQGQTKMIITLLAFLQKRNGKEKEPQLEFAKKGNFMHDVETHLKGYKWKSFEESVKRH